MLRFLLKNTRYLVALISVCAACNTLAKEEVKSCEELKHALSKHSAPIELDLARRCVAHAKEFNLNLDELLNYAIGYRYEDIAVEMAKLGSGLFSPRRAIIQAAGFEIPGVVETILDQNPSLVNTTDRIGRTPLWSAAIAGAYMVTRVLLEHGVDPHLGSPAVIAAVNSGHLAIAYLLLENGDYWKEMPDEEAAALFLAAGEHADTSFLQYLLSKKPEYNLNQLDANGYHVLLSPPHNRDKSAGQSNWYFLQSKGANPLLLFCSLTPKNVKQISNFAPKWFVVELEFYRPKCDQANTRTNTRDKHADTHQTRGHP